MDLSNDITETEEFLEATVINNVLKMLSANYRELTTICPRNYSPRFQDNYTDKTYYCYKCRKLIFRKGLYFLISLLQLLKP